MSDIIITNKDYDEMRSFALKRLNRYLKHIGDYTVSDLLMHAYWNGFRDCCEANIWSKPEESKGEK